MKNVQLYRTLGIALLVIGLGAPPAYSQAACSEDEINIINRAITQGMEALQRGRFDIYLQLLQEAESRLSRECSAALQRLNSARVYSGGGYSSGGGGYSGGGVLDHGGGTYSSGGVTCGPSGCF